MVIKDQKVNLIEYVRKRRTDYLLYKMIKLK